VTLETEKKPKEKCPNCGKMLCKRIAHRGGLFVDMMKQMSSQQLAEFILKSK